MQAYFLAEFQIQSPDTSSSHNLRIPQLGNLLRLSEMQTELIVLQFLDVCMPAQCKNPQTPLPFRIERWSM